MGFWQRIVATILLLAFIPASLAAAMPVVYCLGADGHRAVEFVQAAPHHVNRHIHASTNHTQSDSVLVGSEGCVDYKLVTLNGVPQRSSDLKHAVVKLPSALDVSAQTFRTPRHSDREAARKRRCDGAMRSIDHLASHRTTVLLI